MVFACDHGCIFVKGGFVVSRKFSVPIRIESWTSFQIFISCPDDVGLKNQRIGQQFIGCWVYSRCYLSRQRSRRNTGGHSLYWCPVYDNVYVMSDATRSSSFIACSVQP